MPISQRIIIPKKGEYMYPMYVIFMGGSELSNNYTLKSKTPYKLTTQLRNPKRLISSKQNLINASQNTSSINFKGYLETPATCINTYDK